MADAEGIVRAFASPRKAADTVLHAQLGHTTAPAGQHLVAVGLMTDIPDQSVVRRVVNVMQGNGQFDRAEIRRKMAASPGD